MKSYDIIFCVLTYKNHIDLEEFINSLKDNKNLTFSYKIVVVNNYADTESLEKIKTIAISNKCDFIESENKGYGSGNNLGISFIKNKYDFKFLVVCNPDTIIKYFDINNLIGLNEKIIAPEVLCLNGKLQNPMNFSYMPICEKLLYIGYKKRMKILLYIGIIIIKINRYIERFLIKKKEKKDKYIHACHGSYIIFSKYSIEKLFPVFDENIFLFCEEGDLARKAKKYNIQIIFIKDIVILHKEDGSMNLSNNNLYEIQRESYIYYYKKWKNKIFK